MDRNLVQNYLALRQLRRTDGQTPRFSAKAAHKQAIEDCLNGKTRYPSLLHYGSGGCWESHVKGFPGRYSAGLSYTDRAYHMDSFDNFRNLGNVGEIRDESCYRGRPVEHTGWYTDDDCSDTVFGVVLQLPARNGKPYFIPGIQWTGSDGVSCYPLDRYEEIKDCARAADKIAEQLAEKERDYQRAWRAGQVAATHDDNAKEIRSKIRQIIGDLRIARRAISPEIDGGTPEDNALLRLCDLARSNVRLLLADLYSEREDRDKLRDEYGSDDAFAESYNNR